MSRSDKPTSTMVKIIGWSAMTLLCFLALFGSVLFHHSEPERGAVEMLLASSDEGFDQVTPGKALVFPDDYGVHNSFRQEWWYITANLSDKNGQQYGVQWTLFRSAMSPEQKEGWNDNHIYMAHFVVTSANETYSAERFARAGIGQAGVTLSPFEAWIDNWSWSSKGDLPFPAMLTAQHQDVGIDLNMTAKKAEILQGQQGYSQKHATENVASYYFSVPRIEMSGTLTIGGQAVDVSGLGWMDREWSTKALSDDQRGWDWFSLQLNDGRSLMLAQVRSEAGPYRFGALVEEDGKSRTLASQEITMMPMSFSKMEEGRYIPTEWQVSVASEDIALTTEPLNNDNWLPFMFPYWEGPIQFEGSHSGVGFMEATGY
ncbi:lipocalin-like domain-containing protein [Enterovibrio baiacu]|uniref:lipocalin-like domain-containing protein n=1 Tax=Enterovibrio baiacu TaxID=2491023 RepID=UPI003D0A6CCD